MVRTCENCANMEGEKCIVMRYPPKELFCWADIETALDIERACLDYSMKYGNNDNKSISRNRIKRLKVMQSERKEQESQNT